MKKFRHEQQQYDSKVNPSFSSSLLDEIYRSIDDGVKRSGESKFYRETTTMAAKGQSKSTGSKTAHSRRAIEEEEIMANLHRACLIERWMMEKKINEKVRKPYKHFDHDQDALFFSSTSISSDSSSGGIFSPSDNESMSGTKTKKPLSSAPPPLTVRPKPIRTDVPARLEKTERKAKQREPQTSDRYHQQSNDDVSIKSKSRALKIYSNLKKVKQPISPGGKLTSFLNSLFASGQNTKKATTTTTTSKNVIIPPSVTSSTCSSATSFSRSCLSRNSPTSREKLRNGVKRNVHFYPVSVIVDEDCRPCGHKSLYEDKDDLVREFQKKMNRKKNDLVVTRDFRHSYGKNHEDEEEDDDDVASSCSSSDLFELDHLVLMGRKMYCEELPVYETTHMNF